MGRAPPCGGSEDSRKTTLGVNRSTRHRYGPSAFLHHRLAVQSTKRQITGPKPVRATETILLVDGVQQIHHHLLHELILQGRDRVMLRKARSTVDRLL